MLKSKKILAAVLVLAMAMCCLAGCGSKGDKPADKAEADLVGEWVTEETVAAEGVELSSTIHMVCNQDGTLKLFVRLDEEEVRSMGMQLYEEATKDYSEEEEAAVLAQAGLNSKEGWVDFYCDSLRSSIEENQTNGYWRARDGELLTYETREDYEKDNSSDSDPYVLSADGQTLKVGTSGQIVFTRAK